MGKLKILHVTKFLPSTHGGIEKVTVEFAKAGCGLNAEVIIAGAGDKDAEKVNIVGVNQVCFPLITSIGPVPIFSGLVKLAGLMKSADIIHLHLPNPLVEIVYLFVSFLGLVHAKVVPIAHVGILRWPFLAFIWENTVHRFVLWKADQLVAAAPQNIEYFKIFKKIGGKVTIIPFPSDNPKVLKQREINDEVKLLVIGRLVPYKGIHILLRALRYQTGKWHLKIAGSGPEEGKLRDQVDRFNLNDKVTFLGSVSEHEKNKLFSNCDLVVVPSLTAAEAFGITIVEAFSYAKPVVTTTLKTGVSYLSRKGLCGAIAKPGSVEELNEAIKLMIDDGKKRKECGEENYKFWKKNLNIEIFNERYLNLIHNLYGKTEMKLPRKDNNAA